MQDPDEVYRCHRLSVDKGGDQYHRWQGIYSVVASRHSFQLSSCIRIDAAWRGPQRTELLGPVGSRVWSLDQQS